LTDTDIGAQLREIQTRLQHIERQLDSPSGTLRERVRVLEEARAASGDLHQTVQDNRVAAAVAEAHEQAQQVWAAQMAGARAEWGKALRGWVTIGITAGGALGALIGWGLQIIAI